MNGTQRAIIPAILLTSLMLFSLNQIVNPPLQVAAATEEINSVTSKAPQPGSANEKKIEKGGGCIHKNRYPALIMPWCDLIEAASVKYRVDPMLVAAVMLVESGGQPEVISGSGAVGLLQVMPRDGVAATFQCINGPCFASRPSMSELMDPTFNINYGVRMLSGLIGSKGSTREALFSYGPYDVGYSYADKVLQIYNEL